MTDNLKEVIEREKNYLARQAIGSEEYEASLDRLMKLEKQVAETDISVKREENEAKRQKTDNRIEWTKIGTDIILPLLGLVVIVGEQKDISFIGALKDVTRCFVPKRH